MIKGHFHELDHPDYGYLEEEHWEYEEETYECLNCGSTNPNHSSDECMGAWGD